MAPWKQDDNYFTHWQKHPAPPPQNLTDYLGKVLSDNFTLKTGTEFYTTQWTKQSHLLNQIKKRFRQYIYKI